MAVTLTIDDVAKEWGTTDNAARATRILAAATERVSEYLGDAYADTPESAVNEAVVRFGGYLAQSDFGAVQSQTLGAMSLAFAPSHANAFRTSGAMALLSPYKVRRAGAL